MWTNERRMELLISLPLEGYWRPGYGKRMDIQQASLKNINDSKCLGLKMNMRNTILGGHRGPLFSPFPRQAAAPHGMPIASPGQPVLLTDWL